MIRGWSSVTGLGVLWSMDGDSAQEWAAKLPKPSSNPPHQTVVQKETRNSKKSAASEVSSMNVAHESLDLSLGTSEILVLEDQSVIAADGTEGGPLLVSLQRKEQELAAKRVENRLKGKRRAYDPWADEESVLSSLPSGILSKYDREDNLLPTKSLTDVLDASNKPVSKVQRDEDSPFTQEPPRNKPRNLRRKMITFDDSPVPLADVVPETPDHVTTTLDDDDLQLSLEQTRRHHLKFLQPKGFSVERNSSEPHAHKGIVFSESTDFLSLVRVDAVAGESASALLTDPVPIDASSDEKMDMDHREETVDETATGLPFEKEPLVRRGVAATLAFLAKLGIRPQLTTEKEPPRQRNPASRFANIRIEHYDDEGNLLTPKEAYKHLSHKFHGKTPGKAKQEKLQKKRQVAKRMQSAPLGDTPLGTATAQRERQRTTGESHIVLQHGSHALVTPQTDRKVSLGKIHPGGTKGVPQSAFKKPRIFGMK